MNHDIIKRINKPGSNADLTICVEYMLKRVKKIQIKLNF